MVYAAHAGQAEACASETSFASYNPCHVSAIYKAHKIAALVGLGLYLGFHLWYIRIGRNHHSVVPYTTSR